MKQLRGNAFLFALDLIKDEDVRSNDIGINPSSCDHVLRTVYGLPCAHELVLYRHANQPIPLDTVDDHCRRLAIIPNKMEDGFVKEDIFKMTEITLLKKLYDQSMPE